MDPINPAPRSALTSQQRSERSRKAANSRWSRKAANSRWSRPRAREEQSEAAAAAITRRFERQVDPDGVLSREERAVLGRSAMAAHMAGMRMKRRGASRQ